jgi:hypothetical protein
MQRVGTRLLQPARAKVGVVLEWVGIAGLVVAGTLLVYLGVVLLARLAS